MRRSTLTTIALLTIVAAPAVAQEHAAPVQTLDAIAVRHADASDDARIEIRRFLARPDVREVADVAGLDVLAADAAVAVLDDAEAARLAAEIRQADAALAGGDTVVISTTAIIIGLLILIIILVA